MARQTTYPRIYGFPPATKAWRSLLALFLFASGGALIDALHGQFPIPANLASLVEGASFFTLLFGGMFFAFTRQINGWIRLLVLLATCAPLPLIFVHNPPFPRDFTPGLAVGAMLCAIGLFYLLTTLNGRLTLHATHLEYRFALRTVSVRYGDILATFKPEAVMSEATVGLRLQTGKPVIISTFGQQDKSLFEWLDSFPNEEQQRQETAWDNWQTHPVYPRLYQNRPWAKIGLMIGALTLGAFSVACICLPASVLAKGDLWFFAALLAPMIMLLVVMMEPRFGDALKSVLAVAYLAFLPALFLNMPSGAIQGMPMASMPFLRALGGLCGLHSLFLLVANLRSRLVLHEDRLEYRGFLTTRTIAYADIIETFAPGTGSPFYIGLRLKNDKAHRIIRFGRSDPAFVEWLNRFPNREARESDQERVRMEGDSRLGTNPDERMMAYHRDLKWLNWLWWPRIALYGWAICFPRPYGICMYAMLAAPVLVLAIIVSQRWRWSMHTDNSVYPLGLGVNLAAGAAGALGLRGFLDYNMIDWPVPLAWSAGAALVLMLLVCWIEGRFPWKTLAGAYVAYLCYAWGGLLFLNAWLDTQRPKVEPVIVTAVDNDSKYPTVTIRRADGKTLTYKGRLARNGKIGDTVCLYSRSGALGWGWYDSDKCPAKTPATAPLPAR